MGDEKERIDSIEAIKSIQQEQLRTSGTAGTAPPLKKVSSLDVKPPVLHSPIPDVEIDDNSSIGSDLDLNDLDAPPMEVKKKKEFVSPSLKKSSDGSMTASVMSKDGVYLMRAAYDKVLKQPKKETAAVSVVEQKSAD